MNRRIAEAAALLRAEGWAVREPNRTSVGERRAWAGNAVTAVAEVDGWVFVMPSNSGRPFSIAYAAWVELQALSDPKVTA